MIPEGDILNGVVFKEDAAERLAKIVNRHLKTEVTTEQLLSLFDKHWPALTTYAHRIHSGVGRPNVQN